ncbi:MAG: sensor domain-containing diguanylate cyclase/phosphohydrolase [Bacillota bacterium]
MNDTDIRRIQDIIKKINTITDSGYQCEFSIDEDDGLWGLTKALNKLLDSMLITMKQSEESLEKLRLSTKALEQAYDIIERSSIVVFEWTLTPDMPTKFVTNNVSQFGYTPEDFYHGALKDYWNFVYEEDLKKAKERVYHIRKQNIDEFKHAYRIVCKNGDIRWVEEWLVLERDESGTPIAEKGILRDITEQKELADKLKESEERYRGLFENASALIYTYDLTGRMTSVNHACEQVTGFTREELLHMHFADLLLTDRKNQLYTMDHVQYTLDNLEKPIEIQIQNKNGHKIVLETHVSLIYKNGIPFEIQGVAQDITSRKIAEEKIIHMSYHDKLTGLYNRAFYDETLMRLDKRKEYPFTIIIGDMNGLKLANDAFGHKAGDELLQKITRIFMKACRKDDIICRTGGDEFSIILQKTTEAGAKKICDRIRKLCSLAEGKPIQPSIALGYATKRSDNTTVSQLLKDADDRMYKNKLNESKSVRSTIISSLQATLEEKTMETKEHGERIKSLSLKLGKAIHLSDSQLDELSLAAVMHDIGKIAIPDSILCKPGKLTEKEWEIMKKHTEIGYHIMMSSINMGTIGEYILSHHERWDGKGYPRGLKEDEIPIISRIITIIDAYDVMLHNRPYCLARSKEEALAEIQKCAGTQFDPYLVEKFFAII